MKLKNKKTGEIIETSPHRFVINSGSQIRQYDSLADLNAEWEDYEEPDEIWYIDWKGDIRSADIDDEWEREIEIGNYFSSREEAEKVVEKLKAWKRLKDKGFKFIGKTYETDKRFGSVFYKVDEDTYSEDIIKDLDLLFSRGEE